MSHMLCMHGQHTHTHTGNTLSLLLTSFQEHAVNTSLFISQHSRWAENQSERNKVRTITPRETTDNIKVALNERLERKKRQGVERDGAKGVQMGAETETERDKEPTWQSA